MASNRFRAAALDCESEFGTRGFGPAARLAWAGATARWLPRKWRKRIRKRWARRFPGPFDRTVGNIRFRVYPAENHADRVIAGRGQLPEIPERRLISRMISPGIVFVDIGANIGIYSLFVAASCGDSARIVAFEPHPRTFAKLQYNCAANRFESITCINSGIGPQDGEATLFFDGGGNIGGASMLREAAGKEVSSRVSIGRLDSHLHRLGLSRIDLLKIDIEGFEDRALMPFLSEAANSRLFPGALLLETVHRKLWRDDLLAGLEAMGYRECGRTCENVLLRRSNLLP